MQLDGYNEELKLAWEYSGVQHFHRNTMFHKKRDDLDSQRSRDQKSGESIDLIEVPFYIRLLEILL